MSQNEVLSVLKHIYPEWTDSRTLGRIIGISSGRIGSNLSRLMRFEFVEKKHLKGTLCQYRYNKKI